MCFGVSGVCGAFYGLAFRASVAGFAVCDGGEDRIVWLRCLTSRTGGGEGVLILSARRRGVLGGRRE